MTERRIERIGRGYVQPYFRACFLVSMLLCVFVVEAASFKVNGVAYETTSSSTCKVVANNDVRYEGSVTIPSEVSDGSATYKVTAIGDYAFRYCANLTSITLPDSLEEIGIEAFGNCIFLFST